ncbi:4Fe-4S dicluster domain-containing protein [Nocardia gipuzkoensis]
MATEDPEFESVEMLYIDPETCIDHGVCFEACPAGAINAEDEVPLSWNASSRSMLPICNGIRWSRN